MVNCFGTVVNERTYVESETCIRFVCAILREMEEGGLVGIGRTYICDGVAIGDDVEFLVEMDALGVAPDGADDGFDERADLRAADGPVVGDGKVGVPIDISHFEIDLSEFWLTIFSSVFVAETTSELKVARDGA